MAPERLSAAVDGGSGVQGRAARLVPPPHVLKLALQLRKVLTVLDLGEFRPPAGEILHAVRVRVLTSHEVGDVPPHRGSRRGAVGIARRAEGSPSSSQPLRPETRSSRRAPSPPQVPPALKQAEVFIVKARLNGTSGSTPRANSATPILQSTAPRSGAPRRRGLSAGRLASNPGANGCETPEMVMYFRPSDRLLLLRASEEGLAEEPPQREEVQCQLVEPSQQSDRVRLSAPSARHNQLFHRLRPLRAKGRRLLCVDALAAGLVYP